MRSSQEVYSKCLSNDGEFDMESFRHVFHKAVECFPITYDMPPDNKRVQAANRVKMLADNNAISYDFTVDTLEYLYSVPDAELENIF